MPLDKSRQLRREAFEVVRILVDQIAVTALPLLHVLHAFEVLPYFRQNFIACFKRVVFFKAKVLNFDRCTRVYLVKKTIDVGLCIHEVILQAMGIKKVLEFDD